MGDSCFQWFKDTNLKANHNNEDKCPYCGQAVFNGSKILIWKQITTLKFELNIERGCFQWFKDTNLKANHNYTGECYHLHLAVFNGSKILIWKQITTYFLYFINKMCCFQWFKDTNLKANHNLQRSLYPSCMAVFNGSKILIWKQITTRWCLWSCGKRLFSMVQRY